MPTAAQTYKSNPFAIKLTLQAAQDSHDSGGGIIVADVNNKGKVDYLVTTVGHIAVYDKDGRQLWVKKSDTVVGGSSENEGLPRHRGPGLAAGDVDGDGKCKVVFLTKDSFLHILDGAAESPKALAKPPIRECAEHWESAIIADFRGTGGRRDILLQATHAEGYLMGRYLAAHAEDQLLNHGRPMFRTDEFVSRAHDSARIADIDGDDRDEVLGATIFSPQGKLVARAVAGDCHVDSLFVADVTPELSGLML